MASNIQIIKSVYGKEKYEKKHSQQFGAEFIMGWYIIGFDTLESLEEKYNNAEIHKLWENTKNN